MALPFLIFWILIFIAKGELGLKWTLIAIAVWAALLVGFVSAGLSPSLFVAAQAMLDIVLILKIFGGDIRIH